MIHEATEKLLWTPFSIGRKRVPISHLLFEDDMMLFGESLLVPSRVLEIFLTLFVRLWVKP